MMAKAGTDWYDEVAAGWAARQRAEDERWRIPAEIGDDRNRFAEPEH